MRTFRCPKCGAVGVQPLALQEWHYCGGRWREMRQVADEPAPVAEPVAVAVGQARLFDV